MNLQHRDITPEDYDTLRRLDSRVQPRTLSVHKLERTCPSWKIEVGSDSAPAAYGRTSAAPATPRVSGLGEHVTEHSCCSICLDKFCVDERVRRLPCCRHLFHKVCIVRHSALQELDPLRLLSAASPPITAPLPPVSAANASRN